MEEGSAYQNDEVLQEISTKTMKLKQVISWHNYDVRKFERGQKQIQSAIQESSTEPYQERQ